MESLSIKYLREITFDTFDNSQYLIQNRRKCLLFIYWRGRGDFYSHFQNDIYRLYCLFSPTWIVRNNKQNDAYFEKEIRDICIFLSAYWHMNIQILQYYQKRSFRIKLYKAKHFKCHLTNKTRIKLLSNT